jgi:ubiquinone/menaquinone biosynthesis C-methylase UbiE
MKHYENRKASFREDFQNGKLFGLWKGIGQRSGYLDDWARHRMEVVLGLIDAFGLGTKGRSLDIGIGSGVLLRELARRGSIPVGVDFSATIARKCREEFPAEGKGQIRLLLSDAEFLPIQGGSFDLVTCLGVVEYLPSDDEALREICRVLRPGGYAVVGAASYHRVGNLLSLVGRRIRMKIRDGRGSNMPSGNRLENAVRMVKPARFREDARVAGFEIRAFRCFGGKIRGRYVPLGLNVPGVIHIGDHCILLLRKPP